MCNGGTSATDAEIRRTTDFTRRVSDGFIYFECHVNKSTGNKMKNKTKKNYFKNCFIRKDETKCLLFQAPPYGSNSLSPQYGGGQTVGGSPQAAASPHLTASPQVPSPQGQTLDLSVNRLHRLALY